MYEMLATAAAGLNAGVGLHAAVAGAPSSDAGPSASYHRRTRHLGLLLSALTTGAATAAYQREGRGDLWLAAGAVSALSLPYHLLLMSPPAPVVGAAADLEFRADGGGGEAARRRVNFAGDGLPQDGASQELGLGEEGAAALGPAGRPRPRGGGRLMYAKSGILLSQEAYAYSWSKRYWFAAALSCSAFAASMALLVSRRDGAGGGAAVY